VTKSFAALILSAAVTLLTAAGAQGCGNPGDQLLADPVVKADTSAKQANPKDQPVTFQGEK
jgi:hypothetical protein